MFGAGVKAKCRNCGQEAPADQFKLHFQYKMMVCPGCFTGKTQKEKEKEKVAEAPKPAGWDKEDEYLEKVSRQRRAETQSLFTPVAGTSQVQYNCVSCKYKFKYDPVKKMPPACPYCNGEIPKYKMGSMSDLF